MITKPQKHYSYLDILSLLENRERNALLPVPGECCKQSSSTDARSVYDEKTDTYLCWDANSGDGYCYHGVEETERGTSFVALDVKGCGYISTSWFGTLNEGEADLIVDGVRYDNGGYRIKDLFEARGKFEGLDGLIYNTPGPAWVSCLPITFNQSCKILMREGWGLYYHFDYTLFPQGTTVESFPAEFSPEQRAALEALSERFKDPYAYEPKGLSQTAVALPAGAKKTVWEASGVGAIGSICLRLNGFAEMEKALQEKIALGVTVSIFWDGEETPAVWTPLGGFFGTPLADPFGSFTLGLTGDGLFYNRFLMPYRSGAKLVLHNETDLDISLSLAVEPGVLHEDIDCYTRFHAKWNRNRHPVLRPDRFPDHTLLKTEGRGRFLGVSFHAYEREDYGWWGEGDEKIFVDGEKYPSWFGTGSEDYFGFCWGKPIMFQRPYHAQLRQDGGFYGAGHKVDLRLHQVDSIPFSQELEACIEKYLEEEKVSYDVVSYWYLSEDKTDDYPTEPFADRIRYWDSYRYRPVESIRLRHKEITLAHNDECRIVWQVLPADHTDRRPLVGSS